MNCEAEKLHQAFGSGQAKSCDVLNRDGVYYARLKMQGQEAPWEVALHGVRSELEARLAMASFTAIRGAECSLSV